MSGGGEFPKSNLGFFRGWGADLTYLFQPLKGEIWLFDQLGLSALRSPENHYGDPSVPYGSFLLPLLMAALIVSLWYRRKQAVQYALIAFAGIYMSFGPSFKVAQTKAPEQSVVMISADAGLPTGTGLISANLPGFDSMRASYRWSGMGQLGLWCLLVISLSGGNTRRVVQILVPGLVILASMPNLKSSVREGVIKLNSIEQLDADMSFLKSRLDGQENVLFYPHSNDFGANYLAPQNGFSTYNIGGDNNYARALKEWPATIVAANMQSDPGPVLCAAFAQGDVSAVIVPKFDLLMGVHNWPSPNNRSDIAENERRAFAYDPAFSIFENRFAVIVEPSAAER